jgi:hypothetical protein
MMHISTPFSRTNGTWVGLTLDQQAVVRLVPVSLGPTGFVSGQATCA